MLGEDRKDREVSEFLGPTNELIHERRSFRSSLGFIL